MKAARFIHLSLLFLVVMAALAWPAPGAGAETFPARVVWVGDGDSLTVRTSGRDRIRLRLYGVDAPELDQPHGAEARKFLASLADKKNVLVEKVEWDSYGRLVALVTAGDLNLSLELTAAGWAWVYERHCRRADLCPALRQAQNEARRAGRGLWQDESPVPPEKWRWGRKD